MASTVSPEQKAAAPILIQAFTDLKTAINTILVGGAAADLPARIVPAIQILDGQLKLLLPALANAELPAINQQAGAGIDGIIADLTKVANAPTS